MLRKLFTALFLGLLASPAFGAAAIMADANPQNATSIKGVRYVSTAAALTNHGASGTTGTAAWTAAQTGDVIEFPPDTTYVFGTNWTPTGKTLIVRRDALLSPSTGITLDLSGCTVYTEAATWTGGAGTVTDGTGIGYGLRDDLARSTAGLGNDLIANAARVKNVKSYGATGNGTTDDTTDIVEANTAAAGTVPVYFPAGTYVLSNIASVSGQWILDPGATIKHKASASDHLIEVSGEFEIIGGTLDGNKANQTGRYSAISYSGTRLAVRNVKFTGTVDTGIRGSFSGDGTAVIEGCRFSAMAEHTGVAGGISLAVFFADHDAADDSVIYFTRNEVVGAQPSVAGRAPGGLQVSCNGECAVLADGNRFWNIGQYSSGNYIGALDLYTSSHGSKLTNNEFWDAEFTQIKASNSNGIYIAGNRVLTFRDTSNADAAGIAATNARSYGSALADVQIVGNTVIGAPYGIQVQGDATDGDTTRVVLIGNTVSTPGRGFHLRYVKEVEARDNIVQGSTGYGIYLANIEGKVSIRGGRLAGGTGVGLYARDTVATADIDVDGVTFDTNGTPQLSIRGATGATATRARIAHCEFLGSAATDIDMTYVASIQLDGNDGDGLVSLASEITNIYSVNNTWQRTPVAKTGDEVLTYGNAGIPYTNTGAGGTVKLTLPAAIVGMQYGPFTRTAAQTFNVGRNAADTIRGEAAGGVVSLDTTGDSVTLRCVVANVWDIVAAYGTLAFP